MALPWTDPTMGQGVYPGQAPFFSPRPVDPSIVEGIARQQQLQQAQIQDAIAGVGQALQKRRQDQIANQLLAQQYATKATAANPDEAAYGEPSSTLSPDEAAQNQALGFGTKAGTPDYGGMVGFQLRQEQARNQYYDAYKQAQMQHLNALTSGTIGRGNSPSGGSGRYVTYTDENGQQYPVTGNKYADLMRRRQQPTVSPVETSIRKDMAKYNLTPEDVANPTPDALSQWDTTDDSKGNTKNFHIVGNSGQVADVPASKWKYWSNIMSGPGYGQRQGQGTQQPLPVSDAFTQGRAAIAAGADKAAVIQRLKDAGYNTDNF